MPRSPCFCETPDRRLWRITAYRCNHSAFNGYKATPSDYSQLRCLRCGKFWRTKAAYVSGIALALGDEAYRLAENDGGPKADPKTRSGP